MGGYKISKKKTGPITDVMTSPNIDFIVYNIISNVAPDKICIFVNTVFCEDIRRLHIFDFRTTFFPDIETEKGKQVQFPPNDFALEDYLPFSQEDLLNRNIDVLPLKLSQRTIRKLRKNEKLDATDTQLLMNILNYKLKSKEVKQLPLLEDYVDPTKEDMIFEGVEYDE